MPSLVNYSKQFTHQPFPFPFALNPTSNIILPETLLLGLLVAAYNLIKYGKGGLPLTNAHPSNPYLSFLHSHHPHRRRHATQPHTNALHTNILSISSRTSIFVSCFCHVFVRIFVLVVIVRPETSSGEGEVEKPCLCAVKSCL